MAGKSSRQSRIAVPIGAVAPVAAMALYGYFGQWGVIGLAVVGPVSMLIVLPWALGTLRQTFPSTFQAIDERMASWFSGKRS